MRLCTSKGAVFIYVVVATMIDIGALRNYYYLDFINHCVQFALSITLLDVILPFPGYACYFVYRGNIRADTRLSA